MQRAKITGKRRISLVKAPVPETGTHEIRIRVKCCGICGSDIYEYLYPQEATEHLGHEYAGVVEEAGSEVRGLKVGDRVAAYEYEAGGFADFAVFSAERAVLLPGNMSMEEGAMLEPVTVVLSGLRFSGYRPGDTVLVSGCGTLGLTGIQLLKSFGARKILAVEPNRFRRQSAWSAGADEVLDPQEGSVREFVLDMLGEKADFSLECAGNGQSILSCAESTKRGHMVCTLGLTPEPLNISSLKLFTRDVKLQGVTPYDFNMFQVALRLTLEKKIDPGYLITHHYRLEEINEAFALAGMKETEAIKVMVDIS